jgi:hypothetical protein
MLKLILEVYIMKEQKCVLYDRECINCLECEMCDLNPDKICDNCGKCLDIKDFASIKIEKIIIPNKND